MSLSSLIGRPPFAWAGQRVLLTGGSNGIGLALAEALLDRGARVAICARNPERLEQARRRLGAGVVTLVADLAAPSTIDPLVAEAARALGGVSVLINNAGIQYLHELGARPPAEVLQEADHEIAVNLRAPIALVLAALPHLRAAADAGSAAIVNVSSGLALVPKRGAPIYCATKAALHSWTISLRAQLAVDAPRLRVHEALLPLVDTDMTRGRGRNKRSPERVARDIVRGVAMGREELHVGRVAVLAALVRLSPVLARRIMRDA